MTCRIDRSISGKSLVILRISGRIAAPDVDVLRAALEQESSAVTIDLKQVLLADCDAVRFLAASELNGTELRNCPAYLREWVTREAAKTNASPAIKVREDSNDA